MTKKALAATSILAAVGAIAGAIFYGVLQAPSSKARGILSVGASDVAAEGEKAVLYDDDPTSSQGKQFDGSTRWTSEDSLPNRPAELAVRADISIPEKQMAVAWILRRNTDKSLPATHTIEIMFKIPTANFAFGGVADVPGVLMKSSELTRGEALAGLSAKVTINHFLIGLSSVEGDKDRNMQLLKERTWIDIPMIYADPNDKAHDCSKQDGPASHDTGCVRAILAISKGSSGQRVFGKAFAAWSQ